LGLGYAQRRLSATRTVSALLATALLASPAPALAQSGGQAAPGATQTAPAATPPPAEPAPPAVKPTQPPAKPPPPADAKLAGLRATLSATMRRAGASSGAYVVDLVSGKTLFAAQADVPRIPASVEKLYTTSTALDRFGPDGTLDTLVLGLGTTDAAGVYHGDLFLRGGGDPTFGSEHFVSTTYGLGTTVTSVARALESASPVKRIDGAVLGDESRFDGLRGGPRTEFRFDSDLSGTLSALSFDRGRSGDRGSPAAFAASQLAAALRDDGIAVSGHSAAATAPAGAKLQVAVASPPMQTLVRLTNVDSDNFFAEMLAKDLGARFGTAGSTTAGAVVVRGWLAKLGIRPKLFDGSGLDRADRTSPRQVVELLRALQPGARGSVTPALDAVGRALRASLPVAGRTGTLRHRMRSGAAAGHCAAKTGTLNRVSALAGWCHSRVAFAFLMNGISVAKAHALQDRMTQALAGLG
jgi:D-alanyl-D-alanine carboxypeptidase/D-alanyl-D-alanine-endopeptidase (penicillin-binding protein 4)